MKPARWTAALRDQSTAVGVLAGVVALAVALVAFSLQRPEPLTFAPTPPAPAAVGPQKVGPLVYTVDASDPERWRYFSFAQGSVLERPGPGDWDLAFRRFHIIANGGERFAGHAGVLALAGIPFDTLARAPAEGYHPTVVRSDSTNAGFAKWYRYGFISHLLTPIPATHVIRTADGRYAKLELLSYYCPGAKPGCVTFRYVYQGDGSANF